MEAFPNDDDEGDTEEPAVSTIELDETEEKVHDLIEEIDQILRTSDRWALRINDKTIVWVFAGAALWHCCELLRDMTDAARSNREVALRILTRAHSEAFLKGLYIHYGGHEALDALDADHNHTITTQQTEANEYDRLLEQDRNRIEEQNRKIRHDNKGKQDWNKENPERKPKQLLEEVPLPTRPDMNLDLGDALATHQGIPSKALSMRDVVSALNRLARQKAPGQEHFDVMYTAGYRVQSTIGPHLNSIILSMYLPDPEQQGIFVRVLENMRGPSYTTTALETALPATALLAYKIMNEAQVKCPVTEDILRKYEEGTRKD